MLVYVSFVYFSPSHVWIFFCSHLKMKSSKFPQIQSSDLMGLEQECPLVLWRKTSITQWLFYTLVPRKGLDEAMQLFLPSPKDETLFGVIWKSEITGMTSDLTIQPFKLLGTSLWKSFTELVFSATEQLNSHLSDSSCGVFSVSVSHLPTSAW